ncbi:hypothetical protein KCV87_34850 [Actinosynnema pretiosum subsp. pretiosum]|uniref:Uncharacterized protein n=1 Tax=Actinosynnema pretiosum subsp. pretiosum TaxID=103721 RepID=A0AA45L6G9_9PSEU|nr:hypothetical protein KCV87_34850 [Actinosynnema pretiosum subsp. pretiosum]
MISGGWLYRGGIELGRWAVASKRRSGGCALYAALLVALIILVPPVRDFARDLLASLLDGFAENNPFRG